MHIQEGGRVGEKEKLAVIGKYFRPRRHRDSGRGRDRCKRQLPAPGPAAMAGGSGRDVGSAPAQRQPDSAGGIGVRPGHFEPLFLPCE